MIKSVLNYMTFGNNTNPTMVLLHGFMGSSDDWQYVADYFSRDNYCITIDLPGHGKSIDLDPDIYSIESTSSEIINILDELDVKNINLLGYSMGGRIALYLAVNYPNRINKLMLESSSPGLKTEKERKDRRVHDAKLVERILNSKLEEFLHEWYDLPFFKSMKKHPDYTYLINKRLNNKSAGITNSLKYIGTGSQPSLWNEWQKFNMDCLLISGELDTKYCNINLEMKNLNRNIEHIIVSDAGHNIHFEKRDFFIKYAEDFFSK